MQQQHVICSQESLQIGENRLRVAFIRAKDSRVGDSMVSHPVSGERFAMHPHVPLGFRDSPLELRFSSSRE
jgi:hypothetical protein